MNSNDFTGLSLTDSRWQPAKIDLKAADLLVSKLGINPLLANALVYRGFRSCEEAERFMNSSLTNIPDPWKMLNMPEVHKTLTSALLKGEHVRIVGDYDCDGTIGLVTLLQTFRMINPDAVKNITYHVPDREKDGYGLNSKIVERASADGVKVLISVDIGITAHTEWQMARQRGITGICIDHHTVLGSRAPEDAIVLCPKQAGCEYPEKDLAACGISLQLASVLLEKHPKREAVIESLCKLVAIGTVSDMVPLKSYSNRAIVQTGIRGLSLGSSNKGLRALLEVSGLFDQKVSSYDLGFRLGPRINAAGRMDGSTLQVIELLDCETLEDARLLANQIDELNRQRQIVQQLLVDRLLEILEHQGSSDLVYVFGGAHEEGWHQGVLGIAAAKLVERYGRPALVCSIRNGLAHGSARSVKNFDIVKALEAVSPDLLFKFGGHAAAAGFTLPATKLDLLRERINRYAAAAFSNTDLVPVRIFEAELTPNDVTFDLIKDLSRLEPHGIENPKPLYVIRGKVVEMRIVGGKHLRMRLSARGPVLDAIWWHRGEFMERFKIGSNIAVLGRLEINEWNGIKRTQINVEDVYILRKG